MPEHTEESSYLRDQESEDTPGDVTIGPVLDSESNASSDSSTGCSQHTSYSQFGEYDISDAILAYDAPLPTQIMHEDSPGPPDSSSSGSGRSSGKRKTSDVSSSSNYSTGPFRPTKFPRRAPAPPQPQVDSEENPFFVPAGKAVAAQSVVNPFAAISLSPHHRLQHMFDVKNVPYGVQYEIARYVSLDRLDFTEVLIEWLDMFSKKTNHEAIGCFNHVMRIFLGKPDSELMDTHDDWKKPFEKEHLAKLPWEELDREEEALGINEYGGLGFNEKGEYLNWYGGKVLFHGKLFDAAGKAGKKTEQKYRLQLERAELGSSYMFARRFGSKHFFRLKLTKSVINKNTDDLLNYLRRPLILCGFVFRAFYAKEGTIFYIKTNESTDGASVTEDAPPIPGVMSFLEFLEWHNPLDCNNKQTMAKYVSRFTLGLSNSTPGLRLHPSQIRFIDDIHSESGSNMTDGAGKINRWSLNQLRHLLIWEERPVAVQIRILGSKGLLVEANGNAQECPYIELTPSQQKIIFPDVAKIDPAHCIIDVLRSSHTKTPCRLSAETIVNLAENGVKKDVFFNLLDQGLKDLIEPLLDWDSEDSMLNLWTNVRRLGGVMSARRARENVGLARVKGYSEKDAEDDANDEDGFSMASDPNEQRSSAWWVDETSGCPSSLEETIMFLIDSGFTPRNCPILREKLDKFIRSRIRNYVKTYRIDVPMSASAFLVPDTDGILEPNEVFFKSSRRQFKTPDGTETDLCVGDVLITRHPCKLPTDVRKFKAVDMPALYHLTDVIVFSTKGDRRAADLLSGGDYDGDKGIVIWQPEIVEPFKNAPLEYSVPPANINSFFSKENEAVRAFQDRVANISDQNKIHKFQYYLLGAVRDASIVGKYSGFHDIAIYQLGYAHKDTIRLAYMFCMALDGAKTGMTVSRDVLHADTRRFQKRPPLWKETDEEKERNETNEPNAKRSLTLGRFIMDDLYKHADTKNKHWNVQLDDLFGRQEIYSVKLDEELAAPWQEAQVMAQKWKLEENTDRMQRDLEAIQKHVEEVYTAHRTEMASPRKPGKADKLAFSSMPIEARQDAMRTLSKRFTASPSPVSLLMSKEEISRVRASYAYVYDWQQRKERPPGYTRFPWDVAMRELGAIKSRATGRWKVVTGDFYDHFNIKNLYPFLDIMVMPHFTASCSRSTTVFTKRSTNKADYLRIDTDHVLIFCKLCVQVQAPASRSETALCTMSDETWSSHLPFAPRPVTHAPPIKYDSGWQKDSEGP